MKKINTLFPLGVATGKAHCNREVERSKLKHRMLAGTHAWLWARRRMGKTSLIEQTLRELRNSTPSVPSIIVDLNIVYDAESLEQRLRKAVSELAMQLAPKGRKTFNPLLKAFDGFQPGTIDMGALGFRLQLRKPDEPLAGLTDLLIGLDEAAGQYRKRAVVVMDEFQQASTLKFGRTETTVEGAIKHVVERSKNVSYIFCGSQRHLLQRIFQLGERSLVRQCEKVELKRISRDDYRAFIGKAARSKWRRKLSTELIDKILDKTFRHPYYVNALCRRLWQNSEPPTEKAIDTAWTVVAEEDAPIAAHFVRSLSATQRAMLFGIAKAGFVEHPTGKKFLSATRLSTSTAAVARDVLETDDLIRTVRREVMVDDEGSTEKRDFWTLVDPVMAEYLRTH